MGASRVRPGSLSLSIVNEPKTFTGSQEVTNICHRVPSENIATVQTLLSCLKSMRHNKSIVPFVLLLMLHGH